MALSNPLEGPRRQRPGLVSVTPFSLNDMRQLKALEDLLRQAQLDGMPRDYRLALRAKITDQVIKIREQLPPIDSPPPPRRETRATNPSKVTPIREPRPRRRDEVLGREQYLADSKAARENLAAINWAGLSEANAARIVRTYEGARPALRDIIKRELVLLAASMTVRGDQSARVVLALLTVIRAN